MVLLFLAEGFEEIEALTAVDLLRRGGVEVKTVGIGGREICGAHGVTVLADIPEEEAACDGLEMVVLPGGGGAWILDKNETAHRTLAYAAEHGLWTAAICAAPLVLGHMGLLEGKKATCYPGIEGELTGAEYTASPVETDGRVITGRGPGVSTEFALTLLEALKGKETAEKVGEGLQKIR